jgi:protein subunit release factor A
MEKVDASDDLVDEKDVKTEVMRSRGAGGQVRVAIRHRGMGC